MKNTAFQINKVIKEKQKGCSVDEAAGITAPRRVVHRELQPLAHLTRLFNKLRITKCNSQSQEERFKKMEGLKFTQRD
jgi:hypothetical protein